jgi:hypothetical protein
MAEPDDTHESDTDAAGDHPAAAHEAPIESALPPKTARILAFAAIVVAGICGLLIGYSVTNLQCTNHCGGAKAGGGAIIGAVLAAGGVAVVAVLVLRAMAEWRLIERTGDPAAARQAQRGRRL